MVLFMGTLPIAFYLPYLLPRIKKIRNDYLMQ